MKTNYKSVILMLILMNYVPIIIIITVDLQDLQDLHEQQNQLIVLSFQTIPGILKQSSWNHSLHVLY